MATACRVIRFGHGIGLLSARESLVIARHASSATLGHTPAGRPLMACNSLVHGQSLLHHQRRGKDKTSFFVVVDRMSYRTARSSRYVVAAGPSSSDRGSNDENDEASWAEWGRGQKTDIGGWRDADEGRYANRRSSGGAGVRERSRRSQRPDSRSGWGDDDRREAPSWSKRRADTEDDSRQSSWDEEGDERSSGWAARSGRGGGRSRERDDAAADWTGGSEGFNGWGANRRAGRDRRETFGGREQASGDRENWRGGRGDGPARRESRGGGWEGRQLDREKETSDPVPALQGEAVYGVSSVKGALAAGRRQVFALYLQEGMDLGKRKDSGAVAKVQAEATALGVPVRYTSKHNLNMMTDNRPHQGMLLDASPLDFVNVDWPPEVPAGTHPPPLWVALDEVTDPQNFGAILRSACFLGCAGVVTCGRNSAPLSGVVSKASAGAMEVLQAHSVRNMPNFLQLCTEAGWAVLGASAEPGAVDSQEVVLDRPTILVMGNEVRRGVWDGFLMC
eukprot:jgi/Mesvir1/19310/Mv10377-RA.2